MAVVYVVPKRQQTADRHSVRLQGYRSFIKNYDATVPSENKHFA